MEREIDELNIVRRTVCRYLKGIGLGDKAAARRIEYAEPAA